MFGFGWTHFESGELPIEYTAFYAITAEFFHKKFRAFRIKAIKSVV